MFLRLRPSTVHSILLVIILIIPRQFGLLAMNCDIRNRYQTKSKFWRIYSVIVAIAFTVLYPISIAKTLPEMHISKGIIASLDKSYHITMYVFCVYTYYHMITHSEIQINHYNSGFRSYERCQELSQYKADEREALQRFIFRLFYSYFGYFTLNYLKAIRDGETIKSISSIHKIFGFMPDLIMESIMIRLNYAILMQIICLKHLNQGFENCVNTINSSIGRAPAERHIICCRVNERFDEIAAYHQFIYEKTRVTEQTASTLFIFSILKSIFHLTVTVREKASPYIFYHYRKSRAFALQILFLFDHIHKPPDGRPNHFDVIYNIFRCGFYFLDLVFIFYPCNALKREYLRAGLIIHKGFLSRITQQFERSVRFLSIQRMIPYNCDINLLFQVEIISIRFLNQKTSVNAGGIFELDNALFTLVGIDCFIFFLENLLTIINQLFSLGDAYFFGFDCFWHSGPIG